MILIKNKTVCIDLFFTIYKVGGCMKKIPFYFLAFIGGMFFCIAFIFALPAMFFLAIGGKLIELKTNQKEK